MKKLLNKISNLLRVFINNARKPLQKFWIYITETKFIEPYNINYGLVELIKNYRSFLLYSVGISIIFHLLIIGVFYIKQTTSSDNNKPKEKRIINISIVDLPDPPSSTEEEVFVPPPPPVKEEGPPPAPKKDLKALEPEPVRKQESKEQTIKTQKELDKIKGPVSKVGDTTDNNYEGEFTYKLDEKKIEEKITKEEIKEKPKEKKVVKSTYQSYEVEKAPEAVNLAQIKGSIEYPSIAIEAGIEGRVTIKVLVNRYGEITKVGKLTGPKVFHDEVKKKVRNLIFTPGLQNGKPVKVWVTVPFNFRLK